MDKWLMSLLYGGVFLLDKDDGGAAGGGSSDDDESDDDSGDDGDSQDEPTEREKELSGELEKKEAELEALKKDRDGQSRTLTEFRKEFDEFKKAQMSEEERIKAEDAERQQKAKEEQDKFLNQCVSLAAEKGGISEEDRFLLSGNSQDEIFKKGDRLKALLDEREQAGYEKAKKDQTKGSPPGGGKPPQKKEGELGTTTLESLENLK